LSSVSCSNWWRCREIVPAGTALDYAVQLIDFEFRIPSLSLVELIGPGVNDGLLMERDDCYGIARRLFGGRRRLLDELDLTINSGSRHSR
jgi:hypothetical protein